MTNQNNVKIDDNAFAVEQTEAEKAAENANNTLFTLNLTKPFEYEGKKYESLSFDFASLSGTDFLKIEQEMNMQGLAVVTPEYSTHFIDRMAVRSSVEKISLDLIEALPLKDFTNLRGMARGFLTR